MDITITDVDATFNGTYRVATVPTATTFTYAKTSGDVVSTAVSPAGTGVTDPVIHYIDYLSGTDKKVYAICDDGVNAYWITNKTAGGNQRLTMFKKPLSGDSVSGSSNPSASGDVTQMFQDNNIEIQYAAMEFVKDRIVLCVNNAVYEISTSATALPTAIGYTSLNTTSNTIYLTTYVSNPKTAAFDLSGITDNTIKTFTLPNTNGTLALTSDLSAYLPLIGGTLTGTLNGTSATFSGNMAIGSSTTALSPLQVVATGTIVRLGEQSGTTGKQFLIGIDATAGRTELQSVWQGTSFTSLALQPSGGNVLIGTTGDNGARLEVKGGYTAFQYNSSATGPVYPSYNTYFGAIGTNFSNGGSELDIWNTVGGGFVFRKQTGASAQTALMTITSGGNVGIGTSSPANLLGLQSPSANTRVLNIYNGLSGAGDYVSIGSQFATNNSNVNSEIRFGNELSNNAPSYLAFATATGSSPTERMRITSGGNVLVGNTTDRGYRFQANSDSGTYAMEIRQNVSTAASIALSVTHEATSGTRNMIFFYSGGYGESGSITSGNTTTSFNTSSDYRLKKDLKDYNGLNLVSAIKTYDFEWEADNSRMYGVMAHELAKVIPYAVVGEKDGIDENGKIIKQGVDYSKLVPILVKAIQEQQAQIEELKQLILNK
jgi:hypothetical protein